MVSGTWLDPKQGQQTLSAFIHEHSEALLIDVRPTTRARILSIYKSHVCPEFGHLPLNAITTAAVGKWVATMGLNASTIRKNVFALRRVMDLAVSYGLIKYNPVIGVKLPAEPRHEQRFLTHSQAWDLAEAIHPRFRAMVLLAVFGGMRFGEICALTRKHIIPERNQVVIKQTLIDINGVASFGPPKTKTSIRTVTIPRSIMAELISHMDSYTKEDIDSLVFTGVKGNAIMRHWFSRYYWKPAAAKSGLSGLRFHDLRHTFVALWVSLGRNPKEVSRAAGHSSVAFTLDRYGHLYESDSDELADELDAMLGLTRSQDSAKSGAARLHPHLPPSSSGLGHRPFTATDDSQN